MIEKKQNNFVYISVLLSIISACQELSENKKFSISQTIVSEHETQKKLSLVDSKYTEKQICDDFYLADMLLKSIQPKEGYEKVNENLLNEDKNLKCPTKFSEFATILRKKIFNLGDLHTEVLLNNGLDLTKFTIIGNRTRGGTGNPVWIKLPNTKIQLRISQGRLFDIETNSFIIEKIGVKPVIYVEDEIVENFENKVIEQLKNNIFLDYNDDIYISNILLKALQLEF